jgi:hypothetical protein
MNFGTYDIEQVIYKQLAQANARFDGISYKKFSKDLAKRIFMLIGDDAKTIIQNTGGVDEDIVKFSRRVGLALGLSDMPLDDVSIDAYKWIAMQEANKQTIEAFADWARSGEQGKYIGKYRKGAGIIKNDWARAFTKQPEVRMLANEERI